LAKIVLPFSKEIKVDTGGKPLNESDFYQRLSPELQKVTEQYPYLLEYIAMVPISDVGIPEYYPVATRNLGGKKEPNLIYPTKRDGVFIHILVNKEDTRNDYITIEPTLLTDVTELMPEVDIKLLELRNKLPRIDELGDREEQLRAYLDMVITTDNTRQDSAFSKALGPLIQAKLGINKLKLTPREIMAVRYFFIREKLGLGTLDPLTTDPNIEDISCSGLGQIFIEHKIFGSVKSSICFETPEDLDSFVMWLSERIKKPVTYKSPICDAALPDGSRINIVFGKEISKRGSNFSIRKFADTPISVFELVAFGSLTYQMLAYLSLVIGNEMSVFVSGETASGKTTLLNAITTFIHPLAKIVSIEDTPELQVPHQNWIREVVQSKNAETTDGGLTMFDMLMAALRQRPNVILIGEIRGVEGNVAFQAMQTGHSVMATFHAATVEKLIQRLTGDPILVPKSYVDNLNVVILCSQVRLPNGKLGRRITGINEIVGYDPTYDSFTFIEAFHWDEVKDEFQFTGYMTSHVLENVVAPKIGIPSRKKQRIYAEMDRRAKILEKLHKDEKITDFYQVLQVLSKAQREGYF
jgi:archaeal flagellar protein FlaI